jgi:hypothetical protein
VTDEQRGNSSKKARRGAVARQNTLESVATFARATSPRFRPLLPQRALPSDPDNAGPSEKAQKPVDSYRVPI